jgi:hypothetical protein
MTTFMKTKEDIEFHSDGFRASKPAVNVKVYQSFDNGLAVWLKDNPDEDRRFNSEWIEEHMTDDQVSDIFWSTCEMRWDDLWDEAREIWGWDMVHTGPQGARQSRIKVYSEGRSGGWAIVDGIDTDVEGWDAIEFNKWKRFAKFARADYIMVDVADCIYNNFFIPWREEESEQMAPAIPEGFVL